MNNAETLPDHLQPKNLVRGLLTRCGINQPPTPPDEILNYLGINTKDLSEFIQQPLDVIGTKIRAVLVRDLKLVYLHDTLLKNETRRNFSLFHEIGHFVIPTHNNYFNRCDFNDLSSKSRERQEREANLFAADCIFQLDRFTNESIDYPLSLKTPFTLAPKYNASYEASFRRYVATNPVPCALIVYKPDVFEGDTDALVVNYTVPSPSFSDFGYIQPNQRVSADNAIHDMFYNYSIGQDNFIETELKVRDPRTKEITTYQTECFTNRYKVFQLVKPNNS